VSEKVTYIGAGSPGFSSTHPRPLLPAASTTGDLLIMVIVSNGDCDFTNLASWTEFHDWATLGAGPRMHIYAKERGAAETNPAPNVSGGSATLNGAVIIAFRDAKLAHFISFLGVSAGPQSAFNTATQNIGPIGDLDIALPLGHAVVVVGAKKDDWTSVGLLSHADLTFVEAAEVDAAPVSDGLGIVIDVAVSEKDDGSVVGDKTFVVSGGAAAVGIGCMFVVPPDVTGTSNRFLSSMTSTATGQEKMEGTQAATLGSATQTASAEEKMEGPAASTLDAATQSASGTSGTNDASGQMASTLADAAQTASGVVAEAVSGTQASTLDPVANDPWGASGEEEIEGTSTPTLDAAAQTASGVVAAEATGTMTPTLDDAVQAASGQHVAAEEGVMESTLADAESTAAGEEEMEGTMSSTLDGVTATGQGEPEIAVVDGFPFEVDDIGGTEIILEGAFLPGKPAVVELLNVSTGILTRAYSGMSGQGNTPIVPLPNKMRFATPKLEPGTYFARVTQEGFTIQWDTPIEVVPHDFKLGVYALRRMLPPLARTGPRDVRDDS
jgi:hypothetical protein